MSKFNLSKNVNKKYYVLVLIALLGIVSIYIGTSYGLFKRVDFLTNVDFVAGTLDYKIENDELNNNAIVVGSGNQHELTLTLTSLNTVDSKYELYYLIDGKKVTNNDIEIGYTSESVDSVKGTIDAKKTKKITVSIKNNSSKAVTITFGCEGGLINNTLVMSLGNSLDNLILNGDVMLAYTYSGTGTKPNKFPDSDDGYYVTDLACTGGTAVWDNDTWSMKVTSTTAESLSCNATLGDVPESAFVVNEPVIKTGMIPVTYDGTNWVKASVSSKWYDYENKKWANAVTVSENNRQKYMNAEAGTPISMDDINTMWVWIPRYEYETITSTTVTEIKVNFLNGTESNVTDNYITHPALTFGDDELTGIWVAKFEASSDTACTPADYSVDTSCDVTTLKVNVKPNVTSWRGIRISTIDLNTRAMNASGNIYGFVENEVDTHAMKNMEWGAVAYLSQSEYGKYGNANYTGANKEIYQNKSSSYITGMSNGTPSSSTTNTQVTYEIQGTGTGASTTGNIYGIYDMSGGAWEYMMSVMKDNTSNGNPMSGNSDIYNSGFKGYLYNSGTYKNISGRNFPDTKYYDLYDFGTTYNDDAAYARAKTGDATTETKGWYNDYNDFIVDFNPWFLRGGRLNQEVGAGLYSFGSYGGYSHTNCSFRPVLVQK